MDALMLARVQFAANISFHILFPSITIALGWALLFFKLNYARTRDRRWMEAYGFWVKVFALTFAMGVVSGITMSFQFGTNWPGYMETVGNIAGPLLAYEVLTAFFLEAVFLGVMLFGASRVPDWLHTTATALVAIGTTASAFWILVLNSWMHTPQGFEMIDGQAHATDWLAIVFNPSMPYRLGHMLLASGLTASFLMAGLAAYRLLIGDRSRAARLTLKIGIMTAAILIPIQIFLGDLHGLNTLKHQPQKIAAMEGVLETDTNVPLLLFAWPVESPDRFEIGIPGLASLILTHDLNGEIQGLADFVTADGEVNHPPVAPVFYAFRIMVGVGLLMLAVAWTGAWLLRRWDAEAPRWYLYGLVGMTFAGWVATLAGWYTTEIGRQPWLVQGVLTVEHAVGPASAGMVASTLIAYLAVYAILLATYIAVLFHLARTAARSDSATDPTVDETRSGAAAVRAIPAEQPQ